MVRVQAKMRRLMLIAGLTLGLGILAVLAAILYKIAGSTDKAALPAAWRPGAPVPTLARAELGLPAGATLASTASDGRRLILTYGRPDGGTSLVFVDLATLKVTGRLDIAGE